MYSSFQLPLLLMHHCISHWIMLPCTRWKNVDVWAAKVLIWWRMWKQQLTPIYFSTPPRYWIDQSLWLITSSLFINRENPEGHRVHPNVSQKQFSFLLDVEGQISGVYKTIYDSDMYFAAAVLRSLTDQWKNTPPSWRKSDDPCDSQWEGVTCNNSRVIAMWVFALINNMVLSLLRFSCSPLRKATHMIFSGDYQPWGSKVQSAVTSGNLQNCNPCKFTFSIFLLSIVLP